MSTFLSQQPELDSRPAMGLSLPPAPRIPLHRPGHGLAEQLDAWAGQPRTLIATIAAPLARPEHLLDLVPEGDAFLWHPEDGHMADGTASCGVGTVHRLQASGPQRFRELRQRAEQLFERIVVIGRCDQVCAPRLFGGLAFTPGAADGEPWQGFGDADFQLPRFLYRRRGCLATLSLAVRGDELCEPGAARSWVVRLHALSAALAAPSSPRPPAPRLLQSIGPCHRALSEQIEILRKGIAAGRFAKIVTAAASRLSFAALPDPVSVLEHLAVAASGTRFAFRRGTATFLGATPELLVARRGRQVASEALAGTIRKNGAASAETLLASAKDRHEHQLVVDAIVERLAPLAELAERPEPTLRELRHLLHLHTPIRGTLRRPRHILELAEQLHPTPAVGGSPSAEALAWIAAHEQGRRGWYASPIGWLDADGDGVLAVGLRSALLCGHDAHLWAGAGIVADSEPAREIREIELKQQTLETALLTRGRLVEERS